MSNVCQFWGGSIAKGSELQIEVAEFLWRYVQVLFLLRFECHFFHLRFADQCNVLQLDGSLIILAENAVGSTKTNAVGEPILQYGRRYCYMQFHHFGVNFHESCPPINFQLYI